MSPTGRGERAAPSPGPRHAWRVTTAVRVFALALATGTLISSGTLVRSAPMLVVLALVAAFTSTLEWVTRNRRTHWYSVGEAVVVTALVVVTGSEADLGAYLAVPVIAAGVRHGWVTTLNVTILSALTLGATIAADPTDTSAARVGLALPWLAIGVGVGLLASWQSRSTRTLIERQAPYAAAHHLMVRLHQLARAGDVGLDSASLAADLEAAMREATGCARATVFVVDPGEDVRALNAGDDIALMERELRLSDAERTPGAAVVDLRGAHTVLGYCVLVGVARWTPDLDARAVAVADDFAIRLDTAVLFDDVRLLAASEERNRIAREMHDGVAQEIVGLGYLVDEIESVSEQPEARELASTLRDEITRLVSEIRFSIFDLRHEVTDGHLAASVADYAREVSQAAGLTLHLSLAESGPPVPSRAATETLRVAQEAIGNVRKHARARNLWVDLRSDGSHVELVVSDDGVGNARPREHHWGLQTMRERAEQVGACLEVTPRPGGGTVVTLRSATIPTPRGETAHGHHRATG